MKKSFNTQKKARLLIPRVGLAMKNEFFLEALWLSSLVIEARLRSLIAKNDKMHPGAGFTFEQCLKRIKFLLLKLPESFISKHITVELIDEIRTWKNQRNLVFKAIETSHVSKKRIQALAEEGIDLMNQLNGAYKLYKVNWKKTLIRTPELQVWNEHDYRKAGGEFTSPSEG